MAVNPPRTKTLTWAFSRRGFSLSRRNSPSIFLTLVDAEDSSASIDRSRQAEELLLSRREASPAFRHFRLQAAEIRHFGAQVHLLQHLPQRRVLAGAVDVEILTDAAAENVGILGNDGEASAKRM